VTKAEMREGMQRVLREMPAPEAARKSAEVARRLASTREWAEAGTILAFLSLPREIDTLPLIEAARAAGKRVAVPRIQGDDLVFHYLVTDGPPLRKGSLGLREPDPSWPVFDTGALPGGGVLVAAPGLAFDRSGHRLGRGKGFYDRYLSALRGAAPGRVRVLAVCYSEQVVGEVPHDGRDQAVDGVVTEAETLFPGPAKNS
jgi:5-formyltetrahydrofolate cyclo-ligase